MILGVGMIIVVFLSLLPTASHAEVIVHQDETQQQQQQHDTVVYQEVPSEYCYNENFNLNLCLKKQQHELINYSQDKVTRCTQCTSAIEATIMGYETCDELNLMNTVVVSTAAEEEGSSTNETDTINWKESLCVSYNTCVQTNCPTQCQSEQSLWLKCLVVIMNCNWHCPTTSSTATTTTTTTMWSSNTMAWNNVEEGKAVTPHGMVLSSTATATSSSFTTMNNGNAWVMGFILIIIVGVVIFCVVTSILNNRERSGSVSRKQQQQKQQQQRQQEEEDALGSRSGDIEFT
jgi:heme exporter protein D